MKQHACILACTETILAIYNTAASLAYRYMQMRSAHQHLLMQAARRGRAWQSRTLGARGSSSAACPPGSTRRSTASRASSSAAPRSPACACAAEDHTVSGLCPCCGKLD